MVSAISLTQKHLYDMLKKHLDYCSDSCTLVVGDSTGSYVRQRGNGYGFI